MTTTVGERRRPTPLIAYLQTQARLDAEIRQHLERAAVDAEAHLQRLVGRESIGDTIRARQLREAQRAINRELARLWDETGDSIRANRARAAAAAVTSGFDPLRPLLEAAGQSPGQIEAMLRSQVATAERGVVNAMSRMSLTKIPLSQQVYKTQALAAGQLDRIITGGIARGVSAAELAKAVRPFINPDTPGGAKYAANRLARTELNNAFHGTQVQSAIKSPFVTGMWWRLSGSHPRPDICNEYAEGGDLPNGLWSPDQVPAKPHPQCLCWMEQETPSREEFLRQFQAGTYNDFLVENGSTPVPIEISAAPAKKAASSTRRAAPRSKAPEWGTDNGRAAERQRQRLEATFGQRAKLRSGKNKIPDSEYVARYEYTESLHGRTMNSIRRGGSDPSLMKYVTDDDLVKYARMGDELDALIGRFELTEDVVVSRGVTVSDKFDPGSLRAGEYLADPAFLSTTSKIDESRYFASGRDGFTSDGSDAGWVFIIRAPKGTNAVNGAGYQNELLFGSGTRQRIVHVDPDTRTIYTEIS